LGSRKPSVVISSTRGLWGQRASSSRRRRAVVLLPTATLPAMPMMYGTRTDCGWPRNLLVAA
jgi:hypothetical protein